MITNVPQALYSFLVASLGSGAPALRAGDIAKLRSEISNDPSGRGYVGQSAPMVYMLLHGEYSKSVPERWEVKAIVTGAELKNWIAPLATVLLMDATIAAPLAGKWRAIMDTWAKVSDSYMFDPSQTQDSQGRPSTWHGLVAMAPELVNAAGQRVITAEAIRALTHTLIPERVEMARPRIEQVLGPGIVLSLDDVREVM